MSLRNIGIVYRKELTEALRDRRTLITTFLVVRFNALGRCISVGVIDAATLQRTNYPPMKLIDFKHSADGKIGWILLWLIGVPIPILLILFLLRGCT